MAAHKITKIMKTAIIGAGISGLSIARMLSAHDEVTVFEAQAAPGGLCKCTEVQGNLFHLTGGHCFNSKRRDVLDWFWQQNPEGTEHYAKVQRNAAVSLEDGTVVQYPIENHVYQMPHHLQQQVIADLLQMSAAESTEVTNFEQFLMSRFGKTLYELYFAPYNQKIWQRSLKDVPISWLEGKLPMPTVEEILLANFNHEEEQKMVHSSFYASKKLGSQQIVDTLAEGLNIQCGRAIDSIIRENGSWIIEGEVFERVIFCANSKFLPDIVRGMDAEDLEPLRTLEHHGTTSVLCSMEQTPYTWIYMPSLQHQSHRIICTGNYWAGNNAPGLATGIIEFSEQMTPEQIAEQLSRIPFTPQYIAHHYEPFSYPIQNGDTRSIVNAAKNTLEPQQFYLLGRFAEWEYYNMDAAMGAALDLYHRLQG